MNAGGELAPAPPAAKVAGAVPVLLADAAAEAEDGEGGGKTSPLSAACAFSRISLATSDAPGAPPPTRGDLPGAGGPNPPPPPLPLPPPPLPLTSEKSTSFPVLGSTILKIFFLRAARGADVGPPTGDGGTPTPPVGPLALPGAASAPGRAAAAAAAAAAAVPRGPTGLGGGTPAKFGTWTCIPWSRKRGCGGGGRCGQGETEMRKSVRKCQR